MPGEFLAALDIMAEISGNLEQSVRLKMNLGSLFGFGRFPVLNPNLTPAKQPKIWKFWKR